MSSPLRRAARRRLLALAAAGLVPALALPLVASSAASGAEPADRPAATAAAPADSLAAAFAAASTRYGVPERVLLAVSYAETRWDDHGATPSTSGGYGPMHLTDVRAVHDEETAAGEGLFTAGTPQLHTLAKAAELTGLSTTELRQDPAANIAGGAAVLAGLQTSMGLATGAATDAGQWYGAVAAYSESPQARTAAEFADDVFAILRRGAARTTNAGQRVVMPAAAVTPDRTQIRRTGLPSAQAAGATETDCPADLTCEWLPAPYTWYGAPNPTAYGNHDTANRPHDMKIDYIVVHDTEGSWQTTLNLVQDPKYVSWNYTMRSSDGMIWQHLKPNDVGWHAGNWYVNMHSIGIEHEGFAAQGATWYTEALYRNSAKLVRHLAAEYDVPLDRAHVIGHDKVPGPTPSRVRGMHWDPGPYWDWEHYFDLLGAPFTGLPGTPKVGTAITLIPGFDDNRQPVTGCDSTGTCPSQGTNFVYLRSAPDDGAPLVEDLGLHPDGTASTTHVSDIGARIDAGSKYVVADRSGDWLAVWYLGRKGWFRNPAADPDAYRMPSLVVRPRAGMTSVPVYGRAYPEQAAYPAEIPYTGNEITPLQYAIGAGQSYPLADATLQTDYYAAKTYDGVPPNDHVQVIGNDRYYEIWFGHRMFYVRAADVDISFAW
jgi:hypothetical protein